MIEKLLAKDERGMVVYSAGATLGEKGPAAKEALPVSEQGMKTRRLDTNAREVILKIEGKPVPTWW